MFDHYPPPPTHPHTPKKKKKTRTESRSLLLLLMFLGTLLISFAALSSLSLQSRQSIIYQVNQTQLPGRNLMATNPSVTLIQQDEI